MPETIFPKAAIEAKHRSGVLGAHYDCYLSWMREGYSISTMRAKIQSVTLLGEYLQQRGIQSLEQLQEETAQQLLAAYRQHWRARGAWRRSSTPQLCIRALTEPGLLTDANGTDPPTFSEVNHYATYLSNQKGLSNSTIGYHRYWTERFLRFLECPQEASSLPPFGIADVDRFIEQEGARLQCGTQQLLAGVLRSFLRFLYLSGELSADLSSLVASPRRYKLQSLPGVLNWQDVQKIIDTVDRSTRVGRQHYAILLLHHTAVEPVLCRHNARVERTRRIRATSS